MARPREQRQIVIGSIRLRVVPIHAYNEWQVRWFENGSKFCRPEKTYHTDDEDDAFETMHVMAEEIRRKGQAIDQNFHP